MGRGEGVERVQGRGGGGEVRSVAGMGLKPLVHWPTRVGWWPWVQWVLGPASWLQGVGKKAKHKAYSVELVC
jgi:hypothetical protein